MTKLKLGKVHNFDYLLDLKLGLGVAVGDTRQPESSGSVKSLIPLDCDDLLPRFIVDFMLGSYTRGGNSLN